ncbi:lytic transglycosylase domain-containing protein [Saccharothrix coeruleofusca]|nr:lytic transglycosylase domain-containing protein [Saccharothrix coeruleofusca]MBP2340786.1 hypothetical protein [Saccharothrix coeruleofusca]
MTPRQWGIAATATCAMLVPALLHGAAGPDWVNVAGRSGIEVVPPTPGDVLAALAQQEDGALGATGRLPETDELSAALLAEADDPSGFGDDLSPGQLRGGATSGPLGLPGVMLDAYMRAADRLERTTPNCNLHWSLLAGIGRIESGHARGGRVDARGNTINPILGPVLNGGPGMAAISDTDDGRYDYDTTWDRAVGPMQFIPSTWAGYAADGNNDGQSNPNNIYDATVGAGNYLCAYNSDLSDPAQRARSVFRYNHSDEYVRTVLYWADAYADGVTPLPSLPGSDDDFTPLNVNPGGSSSRPGNSGTNNPGTNNPGTNPQQGTPGNPGSSNPGSPTTTTTTSPDGSTTTTTTSSDGSTTTTTTSSDGTTTTTTTTTDTCPPTPTTTTTTTTTTSTTTTTTTTPSGCETTTTTTTTTAADTPAATSQVAFPAAVSSLKPV